MNITRLRWKLRIFLHRLTNPRKRTIIQTLGVALLVVLAVGAASYIKLPASAYIVGQARVIDGDTIEASGEGRAREPCVSHLASLKHAVRRGGGGFASEHAPPEQPAWATTHSAAKLAAGGDI